MAVPVNSQARAPPSAGRPAGLGRLRPGGTPGPGAQQAVSVRKEQEEGGGDALPSAERAGEPRRAPWRCRHHAAATSAACARPSQGSGPPQKRGGAAAGGVGPAAAGATRGPAAAQLRPAPPRTGRCPRRAQQVAPPRRVREGRGRAQGQHAVRERSRRGPAGPPAAARGAARRPGMASRPLGLTWPPFPSGRGWAVAVSAVSSEPRLGSETGHVLAWTLWRVTEWEGKAAGPATRALPCLQGSQARQYSVHFKSGIIKQKPNKQKKKG